MDSLDRLRYHPAIRGNFLLLMSSCDPISLWTVGCVSPAGSFNKDYTAETIDHTINGIQFRLRLVDPEHPELMPLFVDSVAGTVFK